MGTMGNAERREMMTGLALGLGVVAGKNANAVTGVDIKDDRGAVKKGFDIIYEARELDLPQNQRDGLSQFRESGDATKKRLVESSDRSKKAAVEAKNTFISDVEKLDLAIVNKNQKLALERYEKSLASLDTVLKVMA